MAASGSPNWVRCNLFPSGSRCREVTGLCYATNEPVTGVGMLWTSTLRGWRTCIPRRSHW